MEYEKITAFIRAADQTGFTEFELSKGDFRIFMSKSIAAPGGTAQNVHKKIEENEKRERDDAGTEAKSVVRSPLVGIFHSSYTDGGDALAAVGQKVEKGQVLGAVEAMKLMNDVEAEWAGTVKEILIKDGELVEYGQPLFIIGKC